MALSRAASPIETRLIVREDLGFYNAVIIGAVYEIVNRDFKVDNPQHFTPALAHCVNKFPHLALLIKGRTTQTPYFEIASAVDLDRHIFIHKEEQGKDDREKIEKVLPAIADQKFTKETPPWRINILPLPKANSSSLKRFFLAFAFSHAIGDGAAGFLFISAFLDGLQHIAQDNTPVTQVKVHIQSLPSPLDNEQQFPISKRMLDSLSTPRDPTPSSTWTGSPIFHSSGKTVQSNVRLVEVDARLVANAMQTAKAHRTSFTGLVHQLVIRAMSQAVPEEHITHFLANTAIDMRGPRGLAAKWGVLVSGFSEKHSRAPKTKTFPPQLWEAARNTTATLGAAAKRLEDQEIGLLRFVPDQRKSMTTKIGQKRPASYSLSNMMQIDGGGKNADCRIVRALVGTSAGVVTPPISFLMVSVKNEALLISLIWQSGAFGVSADEESLMVEKICSSLQEDFTALGAEKQPQLVSARL